jgi:hypothetical protein
MLVSFGKYDEYDLIGDYNFSQKKGLIKLMILVKIKLTILVKGDVPL